MSTGCDSDVLTTLMDSINWSNPAYCPPCVSTVSSVVDSNTTRLDSLEAAISAGMLSDSDSLDFGSIAADDEEELTITVTGASVGDTVVLGPPQGIEAGLVWCGYISAADTVTIRVRNTTAAAIDPANATWKVVVIPVA